MKGLLFTGIVFLILLVVYFKFIHKKVVGEEETDPADKITKKYGYNEDHGYAQS